MCCTTGTHRVATLCKTIEKLQLFTTILRWKIFTGYGQKPQFEIFGRIGRATKIVQKSRCFDCSADSDNLRSHAAIDMEWKLSRTFIAKWLGGEGTS
jgi:hypothetical protein